MILKLFLDLPKQFHNTKGLTLIELLIVLGLLSIIIAGVFNLFSFVYQSWGRVERESLILREAGLAVDMLGKDIQNASPTEEKLIGVTVLNNGIKDSEGNELIILSPEENKMIRYYVNDSKLYRQVSNASGTFDGFPDLIAELAPIGNEVPFVLEGRVVKVTLKFDHHYGNTSLQPKALQAEFTVRNGRIEEGN